jgi:hypothetical protein
MVWSPAKGWHATGQIEPSQPHPQRRVQDAELQHRASSWRPLEDEKPAVSVLRQSLEQSVLEVGTEVPFKDKLAVLDDLQLPSARSTNAILGANISTLMVQSLFDERPMCRARTPAVSL